MGEWGRINGGQRYTQTVDDVAMALACAKLGEYEAILVEYIKVNTWGLGRRKKLPDPPPCRLNIRELARALGCTDQRLYEAKSRLIRSGIIHQFEGGYVINKEAHEWTDPDDVDRPRLDPARLAFAEAMRTGVDPSTLNGNPLNAKPLTPINTQRKSVDAPNGIPLGASTPNRLPLMRDTIEERARDSEDFKKIEEDAAAAAAPAPPIPDHWEALCRLASRLPGLGPAFAAELRAGWSRNGALIAWWEKHPDPAVWDSALRDYAGQDRTEVPTLKGYLTYAKTAGQRARAERPKSEPKVEYETYVRRPRRPQP